MASPPPLPPGVSLPSIHEMFPAHLMRTGRAAERRRGQRTLPSSSNARCTVAGCDCFSASASSSSSGWSTVVPMPPHFRMAYPHPPLHPHTDAHGHGQRVDAGLQSRSVHPQRHAHSGPKFKHPPPTHTHASGPLGPLESVPNSSSKSRSRNRPSSHPEKDNAVSSFDVLLADPKGASLLHLASSAAYPLAHAPPPPRSGPYHRPYMHPTPRTNSNPHYPQQQQHQRPPSGQGYPGAERERGDSYASAAQPLPAHQHAHPHYQQQCHHPHDPNLHHPHHKPEHQQHQQQMDKSEADAEEASNGGLDLNMFQPHPQGSPHLHLRPFHPFHPAHPSHGTPVIGMGIGVGGTDIVGVGMAVGEGVTVGIGGGVSVWKKHVCPTCFKGFNRPSSLRIHDNTHTGATPFRCPLPNCGREFNVNSNMRRHHRRHTTPSASSKPSSTLNLPSNPPSRANGSNGPISTHPAIPPVLRGGLHGANETRTGGYTTGTRLGSGDEDRQSRGPHAQGQMELEDGRRKRRRTEGDSGAWEEERRAWTTLNPNQFQKGYIPYRSEGGRERKGYTQAQGVVVVPDGEEEEVDELDESDGEREREASKAEERERNRDVDVYPKPGPPPPFTSRRKRTQVVRASPRAHAHPYAPPPQRRTSEQDYYSSPYARPSPSASYSSLALSHLCTPYPGSHSHSPVHSPTSSPAASNVTLPHSHFSHPPHSQRAFHKPSSNSHSRHGRSPSASPFPSPSLSSSPSLSASPALSTFWVPSSHSSHSSQSSSSSGALDAASPAGSFPDAPAKHAKPEAGSEAKARAATKPRHSPSTPHTCSLADTRVSTVLRPAFAHEPVSPAGNAAGKR